MTTFDASDMEKFTSYLGVTVNTRTVNKEQEKYFITQIENEIRDGNINCLSDRYVPIVTLIERAEKLSPDVKNGIVNITTDALIHLRRELSNVPDITDLTPEQQKRFQLEIGVILWITYKVLDEFSFLSRDPNAFLACTTKGKKGASSKRTGTLGGNVENRFWLKAREKIIHNLKPIVHTDLSNLWNGNRSLSDTKIFLTLVLLGLINTLKFGSSDFLRDPHLNDLLLDNFDGLIKYYDREDQLIENLMLNVLESEDMSKAVAMVISGLRRVHKNTNVIRKAMQRAFDIIRQPENEDKCEKGFTPFLLEIGTTYPEEIKLHCLPFVLSFIESDNATLRGVVLPIAVEILAWSFKEIEDKKTTKEESVTLREELVGAIFTMMRDSNSTIRSRALQSASTLILRKAIYPEEAVVFTEEVSERILDCAITTRKNAFCLVRDLLTVYALVAKFSPAQIRAKVLNERRAFITRRLTGVDDREVRLKVVIQEFTQQIAKSKMGIAILAQPAPPELEDAACAMQLIRKHLYDGNIWEACELFYRCVSTFADTGLFSGIKDHTYDLYMLYFSKELGLSVTDTEEEEQLNDLDAQVLDSENTETERGFLLELTAFEVMSEVLANTIIPNCVKLLERGTSTDQSEALLLFSTLVTCEYPLPQHILTSILRIVSTADRKTISNMLEPFNAIFFAKEDCRSDMSFVNALIRLVENVGPDLRNNVNALIEEMLIQKKLHVTGLRILWDYVALRIEGAGEAQAKQALYILGVCAEAQKQSVRSVYNNLVEETLGERGKADMEFAALGIKAISAYLLNRDKTEMESNCTKLETDDILFKKILELIEYCLHPATRDLVNRYFAKVIERGISLIYKCCLAPADIIARFYEKCYGWVFWDYQNPPMINGINGPANVNANEPCPSQTESTSQSQSQTQIFQYEIPESVLFKFIVFSGALVGSHSSFHGIYIINEIKRRRTLALIENSNAKKCVKDKLRKSLMRNKSLSTSKAQTPSRSSNSESTEIDELEAVIGQIGYDKEQDQVRGFMEGLLENGAIKFIWQLAQDVCRNYNSLKTLQVKIATIRLFGKCMLVGSKAMQNGLKTLLKLWETVPSPEEKVELIVATLLLNEQYPGKLDQCNALVISELRSEHLLVRQTALDFVTYLTLMDILKLRDILPETIICLADESHQMRDITKQFLRLCYEKDTMLHSVIPDLIQRCTNRPDLNAEAYRTIMKSLLGTLKKVTESIGIAEKLLDRFASRKIQRGREVQDTAFCLSVLPYNERMFKKIRDGVNIYGQYLEDKVAYESFLTVLQTARENAKPELKEKIDEYEGQLLEAREKAVELKKMERRKNGEKSDSEAEDDEVTNPVNEGESSSDDEEQANGENSGESSGDEDLRAPISKKSKPERRRTSIAPNLEQVDEVGEESENDENIRLPPPRSKNQGRRQQNKSVAKTKKVSKPIEESESEEKEDEEPEIEDEEDDDIAVPLPRFRFRKRQTQSVLKEKAKQVQESKSESEVEESENEEESQDDQVTESDKENSQTGFLNGSKEKGKGFIFSESEDEYMSVDEGEEDEGAD